MNDRITVGAAAITASIVFGRAVAHWYLAPVGETGKVVAVLDDASLEELCGPWPEKPFGAVFEQAWRYCPACGENTSGVLNKDGWLCGECVPSVSGGAS